MSDYNRQAASKGNVSWHKAAEADEATGSAYNKLASMKAEMDNFHEIPRHLVPLYRQIMTAMQALGKARQETNQTREMVKRAIR